MVKDLVVEKEWRMRFEEYKQSGLSIKAWCVKNGFKTTTFHYWIRRFKSTEQILPASKVKFAEVILENCKATNSSGSKTLHLSYGSYKIDIADGFNPGTLAELLKVLKSL